MFAWRRPTDVPITRGDGVGARPELKGELLKVSLATLRPNLRLKEPHGTARALPCATWCFARRRTTDPLIVQDGPNIR